jgi:hypothetical protein
MGFKSCRAKRFLSSIKGQPSLLFNVQWRLFLGVKRPESEADHSPISSAKVMNWNFTSIPPAGLHGLYGNSFTNIIKQKINQQSIPVSLFFNKPGKVKFT